MSLVYQIQCSLNPKQVIQPTYLAIEIIETSEKMEQLHQQLFMLHKTQCEIGVLQSAFEREPQTVVQISLVILMKNYKRIKLLFSTYFTIPIEWVAGISSVATLCSITTSVYKYHHCKDWKNTPNVVGACIQLMAIFVLISSKLILVSIMLLNAYYLHTSIFMTNLLFIVMYIRKNICMVNVYCSYTL